MEKNTGKNEIITDDATSNHDVVFHGDALVVDYLTTLLTSAPAKSLDSGEINMIHLAIEAGWKLVGESSGTDHSAQNLESDLAKLEAETLKNENKHLKFKTELAHIDAQVLRSENKNLKSEIADLQTQIHEIQGTLDTLAAENSELKSRLENQGYQPAEPDETEEEIQRDCTEPRVQKIELTREAESECGDTDDDSCNPAELMDEPELSQNVPQEIVTCEPVQEVTSPPPRSLAAHDSTGSGIAPDTSFISRAHFVHDSGIPKTDRNVVFTSRSHTIVTASSRSIKPASKIIKQHDMKATEDRKEPELSVTAPLQQPVQPVTPIPEADTKTFSVQQDLAPEQDTTRPEDAAAAHRETEPRDGTTDIDIPPAPAPKTVVRRNVMNYEDLQKEADSSHTSPTGHTIIL